MKNKLLTYSHLLQLSTFEERLNYLRIGGKVGASTFGSDRFMNQNFYHSREWRKIRDFVITRDLACDLAVLTRGIDGYVYIHHMNPITLENFESSREIILDPEFLVCCSFDTHQAIHFGRSPRPKIKMNTRYPHDTCPWKQ